MAGVYLVAGLALCQVKDGAHKYAYKYAGTIFATTVHHLYNVCHRFEKLDILRRCHLLHFSQSCKFSLKANTDPVK